MSEIQFDEAAFYAARDAFNPFRSDAVRAWHYQVDRAQAAGFIVSSPTGAVSDCVLARAAMAAPAPVITDPETDAIVDVDPAGEPDPVVSSEPVRDGEALEVAVSEDQERVTKHLRSRRRS